MLNTENSQLPCPEDISFDSLEYLFGSASQDTPKANVPWVEIAESNDNTSVEAQLQVAVKILQKQNQNFLNQINTLHILIGYMQALLHENDKELKLLADWRFKAAESVAWRLESERHKEKVEELQREIEHLKQSGKTNFEEKVKNPSTQFTNEELASTLLPWLLLLASTVIMGIVYLSS